jgi:hypothetical protein
MGSSFQRNEKERGGGRKKRRTKKVKEKKVWRKKAAYGEHARKEAVGDMGAHKKKRWGQKEDKQKNMGGSRRPEKVQSFSFFSFFCFCSSSSCWPSPL